MNLQARKRIQPENSAALAGQSLNAKSSPAGALGRLGEPVQCEEKDENKIKKCVKYKNILALLVFLWALRGITRLGSYF
jgi:hypothetical protein